MVEDRGGTLLAGVTKELMFLVMADPSSGSSKAEKARKYGTQCLDEAQFMAMVAGAAGKVAAAAKGSAKTKAASKGSAKLNAATT